MVTHHTRLEIDPPVPLEVDAGFAITVTITASCAAGCDLRGATVTVITPDHSATTHELTARETGTSGTATALVAPHHVGDQTWRILFPRHERDGIVHEQQALTVPCKTVPHATSIAVWDVPSPVAMLRAFTVKIGVRCSAMCRLTGQCVDIRDAAGVTISEGRLGETPWTGTSALYWANVELTAPAAEGMAFWSAAFAAANLELPHGDTSASFSFRTDRIPEHRVTIHVVARETTAPVSDVEVRLGLYRVSTDEQGLAYVDVPAGTYDVTIRKDGYRIEPMCVDVYGDCAARIEALAAPTAAELEAGTAPYDHVPWG
jgi:hypothetical protein